MDNSDIKQWFILIGLLLGVTVTNGFARFAYGLLLPAMQAEMGWNYGEAGWLSTINAFGYILGAILTMVMVRNISSQKLFAFGLVTTSAVLTLTGLFADIVMQYLLRFLAGIFGAISFSTAGALASGLFKDNPKRNALSIAILFGTGGGLGIVLAALVIPLLLDFRGNSAWPLCWLVIGLVSILFSPFGLWAARNLHVTTTAVSTKQRLPFSKMLPEFIGYASFGVGYIVYLTFLSAWMVSQSMSALSMALIWVLLGVCICLSPFVWKPVFAKFDNGVPLSVILTCIAIGSSIPMVSSGLGGLIVSATIFGISVFMAPGAITNFTRKNLPERLWAFSISLFTVVFAIAQTVGPYLAGVVGDIFDNIGFGLLMASFILLFGAVISLRQKLLDE